jgi:hypothetical protein
MDIIPIFPKKGEQPKFMQKQDMHKKSSFASATRRIEPRLRRHSQVRRLLHLLGRREEPVLLPLLEPSRRRHVVRRRRRRRSNQESDAPPATKRKSPAPLAEAPKSSQRPRLNLARPRQQARSRGRGVSCRSGAVHAKKRRRLLARLRSAARKRKRGEEGDVGGGATRRGGVAGGGRREGEGEGEEVNYSPAISPPLCWCCLVWVLPSRGFRILNLFPPHQRQLVFLFLFFWHTGYFIFSAGKFSTPSI